jgi:hypothetical protein
MNWIRLGYSIHCLYLDPSNTNGIAIKAINRLKKEEAAPTRPAPVPESSSTDKLLIEIRDALKNK